MDLPDQADAQRQVLQALKAIIHRPYIVYDFVNVSGLIRRKDFGLGSKDILEGALGTLDLAGKYGLFAHIHEDEEIRVGEDLNGAIKPSQSAIGLGKEALELALNTDWRIRRQRLWDKRTIAGALALVMTSSAPEVRAVGKFRIHVWLHLL